MFIQKTFLIFFLTMGSLFFGGCDLADQTISTRSSFTDEKDSNSDGTKKKDDEKKVDETKVVKAACGSVASGASESKIFYKSESVPYGSECEKETRTRVCEDGVFGEWSGTFEKEACSVAAPVACEVGDTTIDHGATQNRIVYENSSVPYGQSCQPAIQVRTCENGAFGEWAGSSYTHTSCSPQGPAACAGDPVRIRFHHATVPYGSTCESEIQSRTCNNGTWGSWSGTYTHGSCQMESAASCDGIAHLSQQTRTCFASATVPAGNTCVGQDQVRTCQNGQWGAWSGSSCASVTCSVNPPVVSSRQQLLDSSDNVFYTTLNVISSTSSAGVYNVGGRLSPGQPIVGTSRNTAVIPGVTSPALGLHYDATDRTVFDSAPIVMDYSGITISAWARTSFDSGVNAAPAWVTYPLISITDHDQPHPGFVMGLSGSARFMCEFGDFRTATPFVFADSEVSLGRNDTNGEWYHIACTYNRAAKKISMYVNGELKKEISADLDSMNVSTSEIFISGQYFEYEQGFVANAYRNNRYWQGGVAEITIFKRPLSLSEIVELAKPPGS